LKLVSSYVELISVLVRKVISSLKAQLTSTRKELAEALSASSNQTQISSLEEQLA